MISLCTVLHTGCKVFIDTMLDSVKRHGTLVKEILIVQIDGDEFYEESWEEGGVTFTRVGHPVDKLWAGDQIINAIYNGHALGLHECIKRSTQEYLMFCDPDVFWYGPLDAIYMDLMERHDLNYVGTSHHAATTQAFTYFPCVTNAMLRRAELPGPDFLRGEIRGFGALHINNIDKPEYGAMTALDGYWLIQGPIPGHYDKFPNPGLSKDSGLFDVGCNLYLWGLENNWRWLSFQTLDCHNYTTAYCRTNFKPLPKLKKEKLLYHLISGSRGGEGLEEPRMKEFFRQYEASKSD